MKTFLNRAKQQFLSDIKAMYNADAANFCEQHILLFENIAKIAKFEPPPSADFLSTVLDVIALQNATFTDLCKKLYPGAESNYFTLLNQTQDFSMMMQEITILIDEIQQAQGIKINTDFLAELITPAQEKPKEETFKKLFKDILK